MRQKDDDTRLQRQSDPAYQQKRLFWQKRWWLKKRTNKSRLYPLGALSIVGKDNQGRKIILPTGYFEKTGISIKKVSVSNEITSDFMQAVSDKLTPYKFHGKPQKHKF